MPADPRAGREPPCLRAALAYLKDGFWPVVIAPYGVDWATSPGKSPFEKNWGTVKPTESALRAAYAKHPKAGVGLKLGATSDLIDIEIDDVRTGFDTLRRLFGGEIPNTLSWESNRGPHYMFRFDPRCAKWGKSKFEIGGVEFRFGNLTTEASGQFQSVVPPSLKDDGNQRRFVGSPLIEKLPDCFFVNLDRLIEESEVVPDEPDNGASILPTPSARAEKQDEAAFAAYISNALDGICQDAEGAPIGQRNNAIYDAALKMGSLVGAFATDRRTCEILLKDVADSLELPHLEAQRSIRSGLEAGIQRPRDLSEIGYVSRKQIRAQEAAKRDETLSASTYEWAPPRQKVDVPVLPFPIDVFPESLRDFCKAIAHKLKCPVDFPACAALGLAGIVSGMTVTLRIENTWVEAPNLYLASIGAPGTSKSPAYKIMEDPIYKIDARLRREFERQYREWEELPERDRGRPPACRHLTLDDTTREAIAAIHAGNPRGVAVIKDELASWINSMDAYRGGGDDVQFFLSANSGSLIKVTRKSSPVPLIIERPCISVFGPLTPSSLPALTLEGVDNGWFDRILFSFPERVRTVGWVYEQVPMDLICHWKNAIDALWMTPMRSVDGYDEPTEVRMTADAFGWFIAWTEQNESEIHKDNFNSCLEGPWAKMKGFCARFALILSRIRSAYNTMPGETAEITDVGYDDAWGATLLAEYFKSHHRRARAELQQKPDEKNENAMMILRWIIAHFPETCKASDISRNYKYLGSDAQDDAITWLISHGYLRELDAKPAYGRRGRPPKASYEVNPFVRDPALMDTAPIPEPDESEGGP